MDHFLASVNDLFEHALQDVRDADMVGIAIHNEVNQNDGPIGMSFRQRDQLSGDVIWSVFEEVSQSNSRFNALDMLTVVVHSVGLPVGFGGWGIETKDRQLSVMAYLKKECNQSQSRNELFGPRPDYNHCKSNEWSQLQVVSLWLENTSRG